MEKNFITFKYTVCDICNIWVLTNKLTSIFSMLVWNINLLLNISYKPEISIQAKDEEIWYMNVFWKDTRHTDHSLYKKKWKYIQKTNKILTQNWKKEKEKSLEPELSRK